MDINNIRKRLTYLPILFIVFCASGCVFANGIAVSNMSLNGQDPGSNFVLVNFDITWENSWRVSSGPSNWDAAWIFVKYRSNGETAWSHATLNWVDGTGSGDGHTEPTNSNIVSSEDNGSGGAYGVFIHRSSDMAQGTVNYTGTKLRWNYGDDGLSDALDVEVAVYAIEMVYVPQGSFYVGDGSVTNIDAQFEEGTTGSALQITSEGALTLGGGSAGSLGNNNSAGKATADDFNDATSKSLASGFPKGYAGFYIMKYEISQEQYMEFLNTLTYDQQNTLTVSVPSSAAGTGALHSTNSSRHGIDIMTSGVASTTPAKYACNLDGDGTYNESVDGQNIACNWLSWGGITAYLDWAALRPLTELEFEKACRGTLVSVADEYAWGSTDVAGSAYTLSDNGASNEAISSNYSTTVGNALYNTTDGGINGPVRVGIFSANGSSTGRVTAGATYYGVMEMSGNLMERLVTVGNATGRAYTGVHGNGELDASGNADAALWPATDGVGSGFRGGDWSSGTTDMRVSDRAYSVYDGSFRFGDSGGRGVRTAP